jgi:hypothetical protein
MDQFPTGAIINSNDTIQALKNKLGINDHGGYYTLFHSHHHQAMPAKRSRY